MIQEDDYLEELEDDGIDDDFYDTEEYEHHRIEVDSGQKVLRIDKYLIDRLPHTSRTRIQKAAENGNIRVNGNKIKQNYKIKPLDIITIVLSHPKSDTRITPEDIPLNIVYEDDQLIVVNKSPGMVVHPSFGHYSGTLVNALAYHLKGSPLFDEDNFRPGIVHRIDKDTSGLLVIAKTEEAKTHLGLQFFNKTSGRKYVAVCWGQPNPQSGKIEGAIGRNPRDRKLMHCFPDNYQGKEAVTHYNVLENLGYVSVVECILETGRTHQIRVHFKHIKHPLFNDETYGGDIILKGTTFSKYKQFVNNCFEICPRQALHAKTLSFNHPTTGERLSFDSEVPKDMSDMINRWRTYSNSGNIITNDDDENI